MDRLTGSEWKVWIPLSLVRIILWVCFLLNNLKLDFLSFRICAFLRKCFFGGGEGSKLVLRLFFSFFFYCPFLLLLLLLLLFFFS